MSTNSDDAIKTLGHIVSVHKVSRSGDAQHKIRSPNPRRTSAVPSQLASLSAADADVQQRRIQIDLTPVSTRLQVRTGTDTTRSAGKGSVSKPVIADGLTEGFLKWRLTRFPEVTTMSMTLALQESEDHQKVELFTRLDESTRAAVAELRSDIEDVLQRNRSHFMGARYHHEVAQFSFRQQELLQLAESLSAWVQARYKGTAGAPTTGA